jgi:hypothetical protein
MKAHWVLMYSFTHPLALYCVDVSGQVLSPSAW